MWADAQEEADCQNMFTHAVIGEKEGIIEGITNIVSSNITNLILLTYDDTNFQGIDNYQLFELIEATVGGAD